MRIDFFKRNLFNHGNLNKLIIMFKHFIEVDEIDKIKNVQRTHYRYQYSRILNNFNVIYRLLVMKLIKLIFYTIKKVFFVHISFILFDNK